MTNINKKIQLFSGKCHPYYLVVLLAIIATAMVSTLVFAYFSSTNTDVKLGANVIRISSRQGEMEYPDIAVNPAGDTIVVWQDKVKKNYNVFAQYFDNTGYPIGMPFTVNQYKVNDQKYPQVAVNGNGEFVIVWQSYKQDGDSTGIFGQRFRSNGKKVGSEFRVNSWVIGGQANPSVAMNKQGNFVIVWEGERRDGNFKHKSIYAQRYTANGKRYGGQFRVNNSINISQDSPDISMDDNNNFVVVWHSTKDNDANIYSRKFSWSADTSGGSDITVNSTTEFNQENPTVTTVGSNKFIVVWQNTTQHELLSNRMEDIRGQLLTSSGQKTGGEINVSEPSFGHQENPDIIQSSSSKLFAVWQGFDSLAELQNWHVFGQIISINGTLHEDAFFVDPNRDESNQRPSIASDKNGSIGIVWTSSKQSRNLVNLIRDIES